MLQTVLLLLMMAGIAFFAGRSKGIMDTLMFHFPSSIYKDKDQNWYNPLKSWRGKYKDGKKENGPKFKWATTFLVWLTDHWHRHQMFYMNGIMILGMFTAMQFHLHWGWDLLIVIGFRTVLGGVFMLFYRLILIEED